MIELRYPTWMRITIRLGVFAFLPMALFLLVYAVRGFLGGTILDALVMGALGGWILYVAIAGIKLMPYLGCSIEVDDSGFRLIRGPKIESFQWSQGLRIKNSPSLHILEVFDANGNTVLAIDHKIPNYKDFLSRLERAIDN